jgi:hypothetical protein
MAVLIRREFTVNVPPAAAWRHLAQVERWPTWAKHIKRISVEPAGELTGESVGAIHLTNGAKSTFRMTEFNPFRNWKWTGPFLWLTVHYDHIFEPRDNGGTKLIWIVEAEGFGVSIFGKIFAAAYRRNLDAAILRLITEINAAHALGSPKTSA